MKCPKCGSEVKPNYKFCTKCGNPMSNDAPTTSSQKTAPAEEKLSNRGNEKLFGFHIVRDKEDDKKPSRHNKPSSEREDNTPALVANATSNIDVVRGKAVWSIGPGQLARRVTESEFAQLDHLKGVVIQEGVTAIINVDGQLMGMLTGGYYQFVTEKVKTQAQDKADKEEKQEKEDKETEGFLQKAGNTARRVWRFLTGTKDKEKVEEKKRRRERVRRNIRRITAKSTVNVTLVSTRIFELLYGSLINQDGSADFVPMNIKTKVVDLEMGVSLQMQITNVNDFLVNYLSDKNSLSVADVQRLTQSSVENLLNRILRNLDYQAEGLPADLVSMVKTQIQKTINERVQGMEVVQILDITDKSADFDRFRSVEHELFASEYELGFLQRTGEFRNRLAIETNAQEVQQANNEEELRYALSKINRDGLLHDDEMEAFVELLNSQKRLREAKTEEQEYEALQDLRKCRLVKDEDVAILENMLENKKLERSEATELLRLRVFQTTEEARLRAENALSDLELKHKFSQEEQQQEHTQSSEASAARHNVDMTDLNIQARRKEDEYNREQGQLDYELEKQRAQDSMSMQQQQADFEHQQRRTDKFDDMDILERKAAIARANMQQMQEHEQKLEEMKRQNEALRIQTEANMTQEQIAAAHMQDIAGLDASAQAEMAKMLGSGKEKEAEMLRLQQERERQMYEQMMAMQAQNAQGQQQTSNMTQQQMMEMMKMMMNGMTQMGQNNMANQQANFAQQQAMQQQRYDDQVQMKNEYRADAIRQQERMDHTQDSALNYTTKVTESAQENDATVTLNQNVKVDAQPTFCPACGGRATTADRTCPHCGEPLDE